MQIKISSLHTIMTTYHAYNLWVELLRQNTSVVGDVVKDLVQGRSFDFLCLQVAHGIGEVKGVTTLLNFSEKQLASLLQW